MIAAFASILGTIALLVSEMVTWTLPGSMSVMSSTLPDGTPDTRTCEAGLSWPASGSCTMTSSSLGLIDLPLSHERPAPNTSAAREHDAADHHFPAES